MMCKECGNSRKKNQDVVYCVLYGIFISGIHKGCGHEVREQTDRSKRDQVRKQA